MPPRVQDQQPQEKDQQTEQKTGQGAVANPAQAEGPELNTGCGTSCGPCKGCSKGVEALVDTTLALGDLDSFLDDVVNAGSELTSAVSKAAANPTPVYIKDSAGAVVGEVFVDRTQASALGSSTGGQSGGLAGSGIEHALRSAILNALSANESVAALAATQTVSSFSSSPSGQVEQRTWSASQPAATVTGGVVTAFNPQQAQVVSSIGRVSTYAASSHAESSAARQEAAAMRTERSAPAGNVAASESKWTSAKADERSVTARGQTAAKGVAASQERTGQLERVSMQTVPSANTTLRTTSASKQSDPRVELQRVAEAVQRVEQVARVNNTVASVSQALAQLSSVLVKASAMIPSLEAPVRRVEMLAKIAASGIPPQLTTKVVQSQCSTVREMISTATKIVGASVETGTQARQAPPAVHYQAMSPNGTAAAFRVSSGAPGLATPARGPVDVSGDVSRSRVDVRQRMERGGAASPEVSPREGTAMQRAGGYSVRGQSQSMRNGAGSESIVRSAELRASRDRSSGLRPGKETMRSGKDIRSSDVAQGSRRTLKSALASLQSRIQVLRGASRRERLSQSGKPSRTDRVSTAVVRNKGTPRLKQLQKAFERVKGSRDLQQRGVERSHKMRASLRRRPVSQRNTDLKKMELRGREARGTRTRSAEARGIEAMLQNEVAKFLRRAVKKRLRNEDEEILSLLSPLERRIIEDILKQADAPKTVASLKKTVKKARSKGRRQAGAAPEASQSKSAAGAGQQQSSKSTVTRGAKNVAETQPSKSLDLVTDKVDDGNNKNGYEAALAG